MLQYASDVEQGVLEFGVQGDQLIFAELADCSGVPLVNFNSLLKLRHEMGVRLGGLSLLQLSFQFLNLGVLLLRLGGLFGELVV